MGQAHSAMSLCETPGTSTKAPTSLAWPSSSMSSKRLTGACHTSCASCQTAPSPPEQRCIARGGKGQGSGTPARTAAAESEAGGAWEAWQARRLGAAAHRSGARGDGAGGKGRGGTHEDAVPFVVGLRLHDRLHLPRKTLRGGRGKTHRGGCAHLDCRLPVVRALRLLARRVPCNTATGVKTHPPTKRRVYTLTKVELLDAQCLHGLVPVPPLLVAEQEDPAAVSALERRRGEARPPLALLHRRSLAAHRALVAGAVQPRLCFKRLPERRRRGAAALTQSS